jgi:hypothetical protein
MTGRLISLPVPGADADAREPDETAGGHTLHLAARSGRILRVA